MKTVKLLLLLLAGSAALQAFSASQSDEQAAKMAKSWLQTTPSPLHTRLSERVFRSVQTFRDQQGDAIYHVISLEPEGFIITSTDTELEPIIAFSATGGFDPDPQNPLFHLVERDMPARLSQVRKQSQLKANNPNPATEKWSRLLQVGAVGNQVTSSGISALDDPRVDPFIQSRWNQSTIWNGSANIACYNYYTPPYAAGTSSNYVCGCNNSAWAQMMRYFQYPTQPVGTAQFSITVDGVSTTRSLRGGNGSGGPYNWNLMALAPGAGTTVQERQAIGALTADIGVAAGTSYAAGGSGAWLSEDKLRNVFLFGNVMTCYSLDQFPNAVQANLDARLPVIITLVGDPSHVIVCDGYGYNVSALYHHLNMGWGGSEDAWYNLPNVDTDWYQFTGIGAFCYNIFTSGTGEVISGRVTDQQSAPVALATVQVVGGGRTITTLTDGRGIYAFSQLPSSTTFTLTVTKSGFLFRPLTVTSGRSQSGGSTGNKWGVSLSAITPPSVTFISPSPNARVTDRTVAVSGTASGGLPIAQVQYQLNGGAWQTAQGTATWQAQIGLIPAWNVFQAFSVDTDGNRSRTNSLAVYLMILPGISTLVSPVGILDVGPVQRYTWKAATNAVWYELYVVLNGSLFCDKWLTLSNSVSGDPANFAVEIGGHGSGSYQWWVRGWTPDGLGPWSGPMNFSLGIPGAVALLAPANNASLSNRHPELTWSQTFPAAAWFRLYVTRNGSKYADQWVEGVTNFVLASDLPGGTYAWWVQTYNAAGLGPWSINASFTVPVAVPGALALVSPTGGSVEPNLKQLYTWRADAAATWYELYIVQNGKMLGDKWFTLTNSVAQSGSGDFAVEVGGHTGGNYQWWVRGWSPDGLGPWSGMASYTMATVPPPGAVTLLTPTNNATVQMRQPEFTWTASSPEASWYYLYVVRNGSKYVDQWVEGVTNWVPSDLPGGSYAWAVLPWSEAGYGLWSTNFTFTIQTAVPGTLTLLSPSNSIASGPTQRYTWEADAAATWYELYATRNGGVFCDKWYTLTNSVADTNSGNFAVDVNGHSAGTYQWWVRGWSPDGLGIWSGPASFTSGTTP
jgi:Peptidase C10 family/Spi protease inhibitor/Carboxypeptidase regulatory-like domain/Bacterial Ig domain